MVKLRAFLSAAVAVVGAVVAVRRLMATMKSDEASVGGVADAD